MMHIFKHKVLIHIVMLSMLLSGCGRISYAATVDSIVDSTLESTIESTIESTDVSSENLTTAYTDFTDTTAACEDMDEPIVWKSDSDSNARYLFEVMADKTVFSCDERFTFTTAITNNGEPFYTFYYGYLAGCRLISEQENQTVIIEMGTDIPAAVRYETIATGQRQEWHMYSPLYATIIDASGTSRITDSGELPEGRYYVEVYYENCYVPEGGTYPEMVCDESASEILAGAEIIIQRECE